MTAPKKRPVPKVGQVFVKAYKGEAYKLAVIKVSEGVGFKLGGTVYSSPSAAAKSITNGEVNGWKFWKID
jgi:hypothetical protein